MRPYSPFGELHHCPSGPYALWLDSASLLLPEEDDLDPTSHPRTALAEAEALFPGATRLSEQARTVWATASR